MVLHPFIGRVLLKILFEMLQEPAKGMSVPDRMEET